MAFTLLTDELWNAVEPLLPPEKPKPLGGRPRVSDRECLKGIIFLLRTGLPWRFIPLELGCGSGVTCWRRLRDWTKLGTWPKLHEKLLGVLGQRGQLDASVTIVDSASFRALFGGATRGRTPRTARKKAANAMS